MEIIYDDKKGLSKLPKNIKQIGTEPDGRKIGRAPCRERV